MGRFRIFVEAVGGHGCQRDKKNKEVVEGCGLPTCPDCVTRKFVAELKQNNSIERAVITHWPEQDGTVQDNLVTGIRTGNF